MSIFRVRPNGTRETVLVRHRQSRRRWRSTRRAVCTCRAGSRARSIGSTTTDRRSRSRPISASPAGWRSRRDGTLFVGDRSGTIFSVDRDGHGDDVRDAAAERRGVPSRARPGRRAVRHRRRRCRRTTPCIASIRTARSTMPHAGVRPAAGARLRSAAARCTSSKRWPGRAACTGCPPRRRARAGARRARARRRRVRSARRPRRLFERHGLSARRVVGLRSSARAV